MVHRIVPLAVLLVAALPVQAQRAEVLYERTFAFRPGDVLEVRTTFPNVVVTGTDRHDARVRVTGTGVHLQRAFEALRFTAERRENRLLVQTDARDGLVGWGPSFTIEVEVPDRAELRLGATSGSIRASGTRGGAVLETGSGSVRLEGVEGARVRAHSTSGGLYVRAVGARDEATLETSSGSVRVEGLRAGRLAVRTTSGSVALRDVEADRLEVQASSGSIGLDGVYGTAVLRTTSGSIRAEGVRAPVRAEASSGSVRLALARPVAVETRTSSGSVELRLPRTGGFDLDLRGGSVRVSPDLDLTGSLDTRRVQGTVRGGGPLLRAQTSSGTIRLAAG